MRMTSKMLKLFRTIYGITQADLANRLGCNQSYISLLEDGKRGISAKMDKRIKRAYCITAEKTQRLHELSENGLN